ncbi:hypothetical protein ACHQM5_002981 [Ranunculus cassubicifolius]
MAAGTGSTMTTTKVDGGIHQRFSSRLIPKRGHVKLGIAIALVHSLSTIFSLSHHHSRHSSHN